VAIKTVDNLSEFTHVVQMFKYEIWHNSLPLGVDLLVSLSLALKTAQLSTLNLLTNSQILTSSQIKFWFYIQQLT